MAEKCPSALAIATLEENSTNLQAIMEAASESILIITPAGVILAINRVAAARFAKDPREMVGANIYQFLPPALAESRRTRTELAIRNRVSTTFQDQRGGRHYLHTHYPVCNPAGEVLRIIIFARDISEQVEAERLLQESKEELELQVRTRTTDLLEANAGLTAILRRRDQEREELRKSMLEALRRQILPFIEKLRRSPLSPSQQNHLLTIETNLGAIISPLGREFLAIPAALTKMELQVANLIKQGKSTRELARLLQLSPRTIDTHRANIRKKLRIPNRGITLQKHLLSFF